MWSRNYWFGSAVRTHVFQDCVSLGPIFNESAVSGPRRLVGGRWGWPRAGGDRPGQAAADRAGGTRLLTPTASHLDFLSALHRPGGRSGRTRGTARGDCTGRSSQQALSFQHTSHPCGLHTEGEARASGKV